MKRTLWIVLVGLFVFPVLSLGQAVAHMENAGFEQWESVNGSIEEPVKWSSLKTADALADAAPVVYEKSTDAHSGNYSLRLFNVETFGTVANGIMTSGRIHSDLNKENAYTYTDTTNSEWAMRLTGRPDSVVGWFKYTSVDGDLGTINFDLHIGYYRKPARAEDSLNLVGSAIFSTGDSTTSEWTRFSVPFIYFKEDTLPQYILVTISSGNGFNAKEGSEMWIDDLELIYNPGNTTAVRSLQAPRGVLEVYSSGREVSFLLRHPDPVPFRYSLIDLSGRVLTEGSLMPGTRIMLNPRPDKGIYILRVTGENEQYTKKVFVE